MDEETKILYDELEEKFTNTLQSFNGKPNEKKLRKTMTEFMDKIVKENPNLDKFEDLIEIKNTTSDDDVKENKMCFEIIYKKIKGDCVHAKFDDVLNGCWYIQTFKKCPENCPSYEHLIDYLIDEIRK